MESEDAQTDDMAKLFEDLERQHEAFLNRKVYKELNPEIIATIPDADLELAILDSD